MLDLYSGEEKYSTECEIEWKQVFLTTGWEDPKNDRWANLDLVEKNKKISKDELKTWNFYYYFRVYEYVGCEISVTVLFWCMSRHCDFICGKDGECCFSYLDCSMWHVVYFHELPFKTTRSMKNNYIVTGIVIINGWLCSLVIWSVPDVFMIIGNCILRQDMYSMIMIVYCYQTYSEDSEIFHSCVLQGCWS